jgi:hypothetical protein
VDTRLSVALDMAVTREREARTRPVDGALAAYQREIALSRIG